MSYSAGMFSSVDATLEQAQNVKLDRVLDLLELAGGERVLEIGCGWGALAVRLAQKRVQTDRDYSFDWATGLFAATTE